MAGFLQEYIKKGKVFSPLEEFKLTSSQKLFQRFAIKYSGAYSSIQGFNNWVTNILPGQIEKRSFVSPEGVKIILKDAYLNPPKKVVNGREKLVYPQYCRSRKYPYVGRLTVTCITIKPDGTTKTMENITIGQIPIMLGSVKCNLYGKTKEELVDLGECLTDPFGYFIIYSERTVINIDKISINMSVIRVDKKNPKPYIVSHYTARRRIVLSTGKKWNSIVIDDPTEDTTWKEEGTETRKLPLFVIYKILSGMDAEEAASIYILPFFEQKYKKRIMNALTESIIEYKSIKDVYRYMYVIRNQKEDAGEKEKIRKTIENSLYAGIFDNIKNTEERVLAKLTSLSLVAAKFLMFFIGEIPLDDINAWTAKRFETPAVSMEILFESIFDQVIKMCRKTQGSTGTIDYSAFGLKLREKSEGKIKNEFENSLNTPDWGVNGTKFDRVNHSEATLRETPLQLWSQIDKNNNNGASAQGNKKETREVQSSQRNHHCIIETPESEAIGYVKHTSITNIFSISRNKKEMSKIISKECGPQNEENYILVTLNGVVLVFEGTMCYADKETESRLLNMRRRGKIPHDVEIYKHPQFNVLDIKCNSSRPLSPYLVVDGNKLVIDEMSGWDWEIEKLLSTGCVEFLSPREEEKETNTICVSPKYFYETRQKIKSSSSELKEYYSKIYNYSHCNIDPNQVFSVTSSICPFANHQLAPRTIFQASMAKQALGFFNINYHLRYSSTFKRLYKSTRPFSETMTYPIPSLDLFPTGQTALVAFYATSDNQEDAVIVSEDFLKAKNLNFITYKTIKYSQPPQIAGAMEKFQRPPVRKNEDPSIYKNIEDNGFPTIDSYVRRGDCVIGKVLIKKDGTYNNSVYAQLDEEGFVESVKINRERDGQQILVEIRLRRYRRYQAGDKMAIRYAQKGTIGRVATRKELLRVATGPNRGIYPDIVFNPHGFPSRQTLGLLIEGIVNKSALFTGRRVNVSSFQEYDLDAIGKVLKDNDLDPGGFEDMETYDGKRIPDKIAMVPLYEQALRHHVMDKIQMRDSGNKNLYTHQPIGGRTTGSGIRAGEMEKDSFVSHGASAVQVERLMKSSDEFRVTICHQCHTMMNTKICDNCEKSEPVICYIPYTFKLLIQLLVGVGIHIKLKTMKKD